MPRAGPRTLTGWLCHAAAPVAGWCPGAAAATAPDAGRAPRVDPRFDARAPHTASPPPPADLYEWERNAGTPGYSACPAPAAASRCVTGT